MPGVEPGGKLTFTAVGVVEPAVKDADEGRKVQTPPAGTPEQAKDTVPVNVLLGVSVKLVLAVSAVPTVTAAGDGALMVKSGAG